MAVVHGMQVAIVRREFAWDSMLTGVNRNRGLMVRPLCRRPG
jgi:hypothetical protein